MSALDAVLALVAFIVMVPLLHGAMWFILDGSETEKIRRLFQPRWKREADFLARSIPSSDHWSR